MAGHPVGVQIIGQRLEEEKVLGVAAILKNSSFSKENIHLDRIPFYRCTEEIPLLKP